jgi:hypothetical protein
MAILTALVILCSALLIPTLAFRSGQTSAGADYAVLEGVAGNDYYDTMQYSYKVNQWAYENGLYSARTPGNDYYDAGKSLRIGFTEYGEFATPAYAGIAYGADNSEWGITESWANSIIDPKLWIQGWLLYMNYTEIGVMRAIEAWAMYSNTSTLEGARQVYSWFGNYMPGDVNAVLTAGSLRPSGVKILYDSARLAVGRTMTLIHDGYYDQDVAAVYITVIFNKDTKYAIIYKDVKILLDPKVIDFISDFSFSERYELDIARGINPSNGAYIHYFHNFDDSVYQYPLTGQNTYDVVQAFNPGMNYTYFAGYWPNTTEYSVYTPLFPNLPLNNLDLLSWGTGVADLPGPPTSSNEPSTPWVIAQWRYNSTTWPNLTTWLAKGTNRQMRFVEVAGMTDYNADPYSAVDYNATGQPNRVDAEIQYMLSQVFNPEDLNSLVNMGASYPFQWIGLGQSAATTDSGGASMLGGNGYGQSATALPLFDRNDTLFPYTWSGGLSMKGTIPYGLSSFGGNYYEQFSNSGELTGTDATVYKRTALNGFAFGTYDGEVAYPPQPIAGGWDVDGDTWFPSIDPLTKIWNYPWTTPAAYDSVTYHPNGILSLGGMKANGLTRYFNDFGFAITREGTSAYALVNGGTVTGTAPTSDFNQPTFDYFPLSTWNVSTSSFGYTTGYAVISLVRDVNGTRGLSVYGWDGRDTFWASAWASQYILGQKTSWLPAGTVALILNISYFGPNYEPEVFNVVKALGTITEFGTNDFITTQKKFDPSSIAWSGSFTVPPLPPVTPHVWWYEKIPTTSTAIVDFN